MDRRKEATLTIGEFGRLSQLSRKALRLYDERGLLIPAHTDPDSGYRYYSRVQVSIARRIRLLRLMEMPLEQIGMVLTAWEGDRWAAQRLIRAHAAAMEKQLATVQLMARLLLTDLEPDKEQLMTFEFVQREVGAQTVVSIRRAITVPAYHEWLKRALRQLWDHVRDAGGQLSGDPVALYYGPVNEEDDGPVEICVPFAGTVMPQGEIKVRELPAHKAVQICTYGEYNEYPKLLEMWDALARHVEEQHLEPDWEAEMTTYEIWHEDDTMTISWPVKSFRAPVAP